MCKNISRAGATLANKVSHDQNYPHNAGGPNFAETNIIKIRTADTRPNTYRHHQAARLRETAAKFRDEAAALEAKRQDERRAGADRSFSAFDSNNDGAVGVAELQAGLEGPLRKSFVEQLTARMGRKPNREEVIRRVRVLILSLATRCSWFTPHLGSADAAHLRLSEHQDYVWLDQDGGTKGRIEEVQKAKMETRQTPCSNKVCMKGYTVQPTLIAFAL